MKSLKDTGAILEAAEKFNSKTFKERYDSIKEEVRKGKYTISGIIKKHHTFKGYGNSLKYYKTDFVNLENVQTISDKEKTVLAGKAGYLLALAENTMEVSERGDYFQVFENDERVTVVYFKESPADTASLISRLKRINKPVSLYWYRGKNNNGRSTPFTQIKDLTFKAIPLPILDIYEKIYDSNDR